MELTFKITNECNLNCSYCFEKQHPKTGVLDNNQIINTLIEIKELNFTINRLSIYGGEPLLYPDIIDFILKSYTNILQQKPKEIFIYTNGTIFNEQIKMLITKYNPIVQISLDGNKHAQDISRGYFYLILKNIELFKKSMTNKLVFNSVWSKNMYPYIFESTAFFFEKLKLKQISPFFIRENLTCDEQSILYNQLQQTKSYCKLNNKKFIIRTYSPFSICKIGKMITVTPDQVTPCHRFNYTISDLRFHSIKHLVSNNFYKHLLTLKYINTYQAKCFTCLYKKYCYFCPMEQFYENNTFVRNLKCDVPRILYSVFG